MSEQNDRHDLLVIGRVLARVLKETGADNAEARFHICFGDEMLQIRVTKTLNSKRVYGYADTFWGPEIVGLNEGAQPIATFIEAAKNKIEKQIGADRHGESEKQGK